MTRRAEPSSSAGAPAVGSRIRLRVGDVAHGGHCVARYDGRVVFVRHTLPGELVEAVVTGAGRGGRFLRADAVTILEGAVGRRPAPCPVAGPGGCGGCDWQHVVPAEQRQLKARVVTDLLRRMGGVRDPAAGPGTDPLADPGADAGAGRVVLDDLVVEPVRAHDGPDDGLGWRTRLSYAVDVDGRAGLRRHRSHDVVVPDRCLLATSAVDSLGVTHRRWAAADAVTAVASSTGERAVVVDPQPQPGGRLPPAWLADLPGDVAVAGVRGRRRVHEEVLGTTYVVDVTGFWQVHPGAAETLVTAVREVLTPRQGDVALDLYAGAGLFTVALADDVGDRGAVHAVESDEAAVASARRNVHGRPQARLHHDDVRRWLRRPDRQPSRCDVVVLDPPRAGAGRDVVAMVAGSGARAVAYVACDPASLARDVAEFASHGWRLSSLRAFDLFPTTHHVECVAGFQPGSHVARG